jgi:hypothetical protein
MSDETLTHLVTAAIAANLSPLLKWLYGVFLAVVLGTAFVVGMVYDVRSGIEEAKRNAEQARRAAEEMRGLVLAHDKSINILEFRATKGGGE